MTALLNAQLNSGNIDIRIVRGDKIQINPVALALGMSNEVDFFWRRHHRFKRKGLLISN